MRAGGTPGGRSPFRRDHPGVVAKRDGRSVLRARGSDLESDFAFGIARQLFERHCTEANRNERAALFRGPAAVTRLLLMRNDPSGVNQDTSFAIVHGLYWLMVNFAARRQRIDPDYVFELGLAEIIYREIEPRSHLPIGVLGKADDAGFGDTGWIGDRDCGSVAGDDMEVTRRVGSNHLDGGDQRAAAANELAVSLTNIQLAISRHSAGGHTMAARRWFSYRRHVGVLHSIGLRGKGDWL